VRAGLLTTVQDRGRIGCQKFGVTVSGAVDEVALRVGNILVGNDQNAAGLEISLLGPRLRFRAGAVLALTGAELDADLDGQLVPWCEAFPIRAGQTLTSATLQEGDASLPHSWGGIDVPVRLGVVPQPGSRLADSRAALSRRRCSLVGPTIGGPCVSRVAPRPGTGGRSSVRRRRFGSSSGRRTTRSRRRATHACGIRP
jgi:hypothetical protein